MSCSSTRITFNKSGTPWLDIRDTSLSWLALGVLLAAWNTCDDDPRTHLTPRPDILREYPVVSKRALRGTALPHMTAVRVPQGR